MSGFDSEKKERLPQPRFPGQFLRDQIRVIVADAEEVIVLLLMTWTIVLLVTVNYYRPSQPRPWLFIAFAVAATWWCWKKVQTSMAVRQKLEVGLRGEQYLGRFLEEELMPHGYRIVHDVQGGGFNIDHVVLGHTGLFAIECKTRTKIGHRQHQVFYDGNKVLVDGMSPDRDPIAQARAQGKWLENRLKQSLGKTLKVQPVVIFPTWFVTRNPKNADVWVLNEKAAVSFILHHQEDVPPEAVAAAAVILKNG